MRKIIQFKLEISMSNFFGLCVPKTLCRHCDRNETLKAIHLPGISGSKLDVVRGLKIVGFEHSGKNGGSLALKCKKCKTKFKLCFEENTWRIPLPSRRTSPSLPPVHSGSCSKTIVFHGRPQQFYDDLVGRGFALVDYLEERGVIILHCPFCSKVIELEKVKEMWLVIGDLDHVEDCNRDEVRIQVQQARGLEGPYDIQNAPVCVTPPKRVIPFRRTQLCSVWNRCNERDRAQRKETINT
jgi:hypothetical protein